MIIKKNEGLLITNKVVRKFKNVFNLNMSNQIETEENNNIIVEQYFNELP